MHFRHFASAMASGLATAAFADVWDVPEATSGALSLSKRQVASYAFRPNPARTRQGTDCAATFGAGYLLCNPSAFLTKHCYNPALGQSCCEESWICPSGSFCLVNGYCCPNDIDPGTCALRNRVSLPPTFHTTAAAAASAMANGTATVPTAQNTSLTYALPWATAAAATTRTLKKSPAGNATTTYWVPPLPSQTQSGTVAEAATHAQSTTAPVLITGAVVTAAPTANVTRVADEATSTTVLEFTGAAGLPIAGAAGRGVAAAICVVGLVGTFL